MDRTREEEIFLFSVIPSESPLSLRILIKRCVLLIRYYRKYFIYITFPVSNYRHAVGLINTSLVFMALVIHL